MSIWAKLIAVGLLVAMLAGGLWKIRHGGVVQGRAEVQAKWDTEKTALVELAQRTRDNQTQANQKVDRDYQAQKSRIAAANRATDDLLREYQAAAADSSTAAPECRIDGDPRPLIAAQCTAALVRLDAAVKSLAGQTGGLQDYARTMRVTQ